MTINLNGVELYTAQEVEARIREAIAGKDKQVGMSNLPIGTLVKVVSNSSSHSHNVGEILPITEVDKSDRNMPYRLGGRSAGWVNLDDIEFLSFPEEEESTSGDERLSIDDLREKDVVKFLVEHTDSYGDTVPKGHCAAVRTIQNDDIIVGTGSGQSVKHDEIPIVLTKIDEYSNVSDEEGDTDDRDNGFRNGDYAKVVKDHFKFDIGEVVKIEDAEGDGMPLVSTEDKIGYIDVDSLVKDTLELVEESEDEETDKYPAVGTKVKALSNCVDRTKGKVYEVVKIDESSVYPIKVTDDSGTNGYKLESTTSGTFEDFFEILEPLGQDANGEDLYEGDAVKVLRNLTEGFDEGTIGKVVEMLPWGSLMIESDYDGPYSHPGSALELVEESEEESEPEFKVGDKVRLVDAKEPIIVLRKVGSEGNIDKILRDGKLRVAFGDDTQYTMPSQVEKVDGEEDSEIKAGDTVIATEDEFDITKGSEYEIKERESGLLYFHDDYGDIRHVSVHEEILRKKDAKRGFNVGDIVHVKESFTDATGDTANVGVGEIKLGAFSGNLYVRASRTEPSVAIEGHEDKLTLVCRAEDRLDK